VVTVKRVVCIVGAFIEYFLKTAQAQVGSIVPSIDQLANDYPCSTENLVLKRGNSKVAN